MQQLKNLTTTEKVQMVRLCRNQTPDVYNKVYEKKGQIYFSNVLLKKLKIKSGNVLRRGAWMTTQGKRRKGMQLKNKSGLTPFSLVPGG